MVTGLIFTGPMVGRVSIQVSLLALASVCAGCGQSVQPITVASGCPGQPLRGPARYASEPQDLLIDNFEDGNTRLAPVGDRDGSWILGQDFRSAVLIDEISEDCAASGRFAGHFGASGSPIWGNNWTAVFRNSAGTALPYDGSKYSAISFWAAFGGDNDVDFEVPMGLTTMDNAWNSGGGCTVCMDFYAAKVPLAHDWQHFVIRFDEMVQSGVGIPQVPMRRDQMVGFIIWPRQQFDIWIDDVRVEP